MEMASVSAQCTQCADVNGFHDDLPPATPSLDGATFICTLMFLASRVPVTVGARPDGQQGKSVDSMETVQITLHR